MAAALSARLWFFAIRARRLIEGTGKDTGKGLPRIKAVFQADIINPLVGISQVARRQQQFTLANVAPETFPLYRKNSRCRCHFEYPACAQYHQYAAVDADCHQSIPR